MQTIRRVVIDTGHGENGDPGAVYGGRTEAAEVAWQGAELAALLRAYAFETLVVANERNLTRGQIGALAKPGDVLLSLHLNASPARGARGHEILILPRPGPHDEHLARLLLAYLDDSLRDQPSRGIKYAQLAVLSGAPRAVPKCLVESTFLDGPAYSRELLERANEGIAAGLLAFRASMARV